MSALALVEPLPSVSADHGRFRWHIRVGKTFWSPSVYRLHGYQPGAVVPSAALALGHKHPDDLHGCVDVLHESILTDRVIVHEHRIVSTDGVVRQVLMIARPVVDELGSVEQLCGFLLPVEDEGEGDHAAPSISGACSWLSATLTISTGAARVLMAAQRPISAWRHPALPPQENAATTSSSSQQRRDLEDRMFPLEHLTLGRIPIPL